MDSPDFSLSEQRRKQALKRQRTVLALWYMSEADLSRTRFLDEFSSCDSFVA
jgi:hypothetical protein